jgi:hypothetical protein
MFADHIGFLGLQQGPGNLIGKRHASLAVRGDDRISDARERSLKSLPLTPLGILCTHSPLDRSPLRMTQQSDTETQYYEKNQSDLIGPTGDNKGLHWRHEEIVQSPNGKENGQHGSAKPAEPRSE